MDSYLRVIWGEKVMTELCAVAFGSHIDNLTFNIQDIALICYNHQWDYIAESADP